MTTTVKWAGTNNPSKVSFAERRSGLKSSRKFPAPRELTCSPKRHLCRRVFYRSPVCLKANSHRHAGHDKTVLSLSCPIRRCKLYSRQLKTVADRTFEVRTRSEQSSNSQRHNRHDADRTVLSCLAGGVNWALHRHRQTTVGAKQSKSHELFSISE